MALGGVISGAVKALQKELRELNENPVEGFTVKLADESNMFLWDVAIFGPPMTLYEGGYFKAQLFFRNDYPYSPPSMRFLSKMFHPNIYEAGEVCISILHYPGDDPHSGEEPSERWNPTQNVRTILLSVISLLNEPNIHSAAHVDASVAYRKWKESGGREDTYEKTVRSYVDLTHADALNDGVVVPTTLEEYCLSGRNPDRSGSYGLAGLDGPSYSDYDDDDEPYCFDADDDDDEEAAGSGGVGGEKDDAEGGVDSAMEETECDPACLSSTTSGSSKKHNLGGNTPGSSAAGPSDHTTTLNTGDGVGQH